MLYAESTLPVYRFLSRCERVLPTALQEHLDGVQGDVEQYLETRHQGP